MATEQNKSVGLTPIEMARTAGQLGNWLMGLLALPCTRNSLWLSVFGRLSVSGVFGRVSDTRSLC